MSEKPFGETFYRNYDPIEVNTIEDAIGLFTWLSEKNAEDNQTTASEVYADCANTLEQEVLDRD